MEHLPSLTILLVEDNTETRELYADILKESGHYVTMVTDGKEALVEISKNQYDLVLLDMMMPIVNGIQFLKQLKTINLSKQPKIIILTNISHDHIIDDALENGADGFLMKSDMTPQQFISKIHEVCFPK
jgi:CheY-like chemotaxis protein